MPLDPFFEERLRVHRRYLLDRAITRARTRLAALWPFGRDSVPPPTAPASAAASPAPAPSSETPARTPRPGPRARSRAKHRRAALAWDRTELRTVGIPGPDLRITEHRVAVPGRPDVRVRIYHPPASDATPVAAVLALFGGAFRIGGIDYPTTDAAFRRRAHDAGVAVVAVDYALAPEHRHPVAVEQSYAALDWLFARAEDLGVDAQRIGVMGISAGANLAAVTALLNRDRAAHPLRLQLLEVPVVDLTGEHVDLRAARALGIPRFLAVRELRSVARTYLADPRDARLPTASPLLAPSHSGLPPTVILTAEFDPLRGDGAAYVDALRRAGVDASAVQYLGVTHDTPIFGAALPAARRWHAEVVAALRTLHG